MNTLDSGRLQGKEFDGGTCLGFVQGMTNTIMVYQMVHGIRVGACLPENGIENGQALRVIVRYLRANPQSLHQPGTALAYLALSDAFPCPQR